MLVFVGDMFDCSWKSQLYGRRVWEWQYSSISWRCHERKVSLLWWSLILKSLSIKRKHL